MQVASNLWQAVRFFFLSREGEDVCRESIGFFFSLSHEKNLAQEQKSRRLQKKTSIEHTTWMLLNMNILYVIICSKC